LGLLSPTRRRVRRILDGLVAEGRLQREAWFREIGRPFAGLLSHGKSPFLEHCCGQ